MSSIIISQQLVLLFMQELVAYHLTSKSLLRMNSLKWKAWASFKSQTVCGHPPLHNVPKPQGGWRPCGDYRRLNDVATPNRYPIPHLQDHTTLGKEHFSKIYLIRGNHQIPVASEDIPKTDIITPVGLYEYLRMPFARSSYKENLKDLKLCVNICVSYLGFKKFVKLYLQSSDLSSLR